MCRPVVLLVAPSRTSTCDSEARSVSVINPICAPWFESRWSAPPVPEPQWYAVHTRSRHEKLVVNQLEQRGIKTFLPTINEVHHWTDRRKVVQLPLFSCYAFVHMRLLPEIWHKVMRTDGVLRLVGGRGEGVPIPESAIENLQALLSRDVPYTLCPFLQVGQRVRIRGGALDGIEGLLIARKGDRTLVISIEPIQRSIAVRVDQYQVEAI
ncbi:MAG: UpxY family transcription antiterminator [Terriglobales bacterium]